MEKFSNQSNNLLKVLLILFLETRMKKLLTHSANSKFISHPAAQRDIYYKEMQNCLFVVQGCKLCNGSEADKFHKAFKTPKILIIPISLYHN